MDIRELMKQFEAIMSAAAYAETGEFDTARKIISERRKVLLVLTGKESDMKAAKYALNVSKRIWAGIEILYITHDSSEKSFLEGYVRELKTKGIDCQVTMGQGSLKEEIRKFMEKMKDKDIQFVVIDSQDLGIDCEKKEGTVLHGWEGLECPLVLVSNVAKA